MMHGFSVAAGSTVGRDHQHTYRNNQDSFCVLDDGEVLVGVVADGCGSGKHSEIGATVGARLVAKRIRSVFDPHHGSVDWDEAQCRILEDLDMLARMVSDGAYGYVQTVLDYLLFTTVGVVADRHRTTFFVVGDGTVIVNGQTTRSEYPNNQPPYLAYALISSSVDIDDQLLQLRPFQTWPSEAVTSFLLGTDGIDDLIRHETTPLPGGAVPVGPISQFWTDDRYFRGNPELLSRRLRLAARDWPHADPDPGLLRDDTTVISGRRTNESEESCSQSI